MEITPRYIIGTFILLGIFIYPIRLGANWIKEPLRYKLLNLCVGTAMILTIQIVIALLISIFRKIYNNLDLVLFTI